MKIFDTHIHLNIEPLCEKALTLLKEYQQSDILINIIGTTTVDSQIAVDLASQSPLGYCTVGIHPVEYKYHTDAAMETIEKIYLEHKDKVIAIGECGLDYHYSDTNKASQEKYFRKQIELAIKYALPLVVHIRDAHDAALLIFDQYPQLQNVIIHCYSDSEKFAVEYIKRGFYISFSGIITFKKADELRALIKSLPFDKILTETDAPWLCPEPHRGQTNDASKMIHINQCVADLKNLDLETTNKKLMLNALNALKLYKLKKD